MPRVLDNIGLSLVTALRETLPLAHRADFCVGYFNLRGWRLLDDLIEPWPGLPEQGCRLLIGMQRLPKDDLRDHLRVAPLQDGIDNQTAVKLKARVAADLREQLTFGLPTNKDEAGLRKLADQIRQKKVAVKLFLRHLLHAKLYLLHRHDPINPIVGYLGSSNLTFSGLSSQGELNIDVLDLDACKKLSAWFEERWNDRWCLDISEELATILEESWARATLTPPYHIYLKMAYHLSREARAGLSEFSIPSDFQKRLFEYQVAAVKIAAHHLHKRNGVLIGDVVGLGKTLMATAVARIFDDDFSFETLLLCPKNLVQMWEDYFSTYRLHGKVMSISLVLRELPNLRRYRLVIIDESHNLRNPEGRRYRAIQSYIQKNDSKVILLSATPYNKSYSDLSAQLRLFVPDDHDLGIRPEKLVRELGEANFLSTHQCAVRTLAAFEKSQYPDDWRELMRLYMVRRTRGFIQDNYAKCDPDSGRRFFTLEDGSRSYFPVRQPRTVKFSIDESDPSDAYARLFAPDVVDVINALELPRYGLGGYLLGRFKHVLSPEEEKVIKDLSRAGKRLMGFCRTNLYKRLESSGHAFIQSVKRHILRNYLFLHALEGKLPLPIGPQESELLDARGRDEDLEDATASGPLDAAAAAEPSTGDAPEPSDSSDETAAPAEEPLEASSLAKSDKALRKQAAELYALYETKFKKRFKWLSTTVFNKELSRHLKGDAAALLKILQRCGEWSPLQDSKLKALRTLLEETHAHDKVLVFSQFADTVRYLERALLEAGLTQVAAATGDSENPTSLAWRFSPQSNQKTYPTEEHLRILIATDVLSEGQNLQDAAIVVNFDLPWAIIRLIQRAGRVDRIGQQAERISCYSFLPAEGVERIIRLRARVRERLKENAEVVGTDEAFFEDDRNDQAVIELYHEKAGILDGEPDTDVDLASHAYQIWKNATQANPMLETLIPELPAVSYSARAHVPSPMSPAGALVYMRTGEGNDALAWIDLNGRSVTESQFAILKAAACSLDTPALPRGENHHDLVRRAAELIADEERSIGGQLGRQTGARYRTYERLMRYAEGLKGTLFESTELNQAIDELYRHPLRPSAQDTLTRQLRAHVSDKILAQLVITLRSEGQLCVVHDEEVARDPHIICSLGLVADSSHQ